MRTLLDYLSKVPRFLQLSMIGLIVLSLPVMASAFGPDRPTFDYNKGPVNGTTCTAADEAAHDQCGSMTGPVFDSFINAPGYGNEESFVTISPSASGQTNPVGNSYSHTLNAVPGQEYWLRIYVHNNANQGLNCSSDHRDPTTGDCSQLDPGSIGIATGTHVQLAFNQGQANGHDLKAYISANNAAQVWDEATLTNNATQFSLAYVPGSAEILTNKQNTTLQPLSDDIAGPNGVAVGQDFNGTANTSGDYPGCFNFASRIYVKVVVKAPSLKIVKQAFVTGTQEEVDGKTVAPGTHIHWAIHVYNVGNDIANNLTVRDTLPQGDTFTSGTLKWYDASQNGVVQDSNHENVFFNQGGINLGNYSALTADEQSKGFDSADLTYDTVADGTTVCQMTNTAFVRATGVTETSASATVNVSNSSCTSKPPVTHPAPKVLPNTGNGAGTVAGIFAATTVAGALLHRYFLGRRFNS